MEKIPIKGRIFLLMGLTGILVSYVRHVIQYGKAWTSISSFLGSSVAHYFLVIVVAAISYELINKIKNIFFVDETSEKIITFEQSGFYTSVTILVSAIIILLIIGNYHFTR